MPAPEILAILDRLNQAYPDKRLTKSTLKLYVVELSDIPALLLDQAVSHHIQTSPWFPHISDLRQAAQQIAGSTDFASLQTPGVDFLNLEAFHLENDYFQRGRFDLRTWDELADQLNRVGRSHQAHELRSKARHIQECEAATQRGEEYPPRPDRLRYAQWDTQG
jgi:hypothetical protein